jgi:hypothetical protein
MRLDPRLWRHLRIPLDHPTLDLDRAAERVHDARKQNQQSVASRPHYPTVVLLNFGVHECVVMSVQVSEGALVVSAYQAAVADHIGHENSRQPPLARAPWPVIVVA